MADIFTEKMLVGETVAHYPETREVFEQFGIDYCCGGEKDLETAAAENGVVLVALRNALREATERPALGVERKDWTHESLTALADHIEERHHAFMKTQLPRLRELLTKVVEAHGERHGRVLSLLEETFDLLKAEIELHHLKEEQILFPYVRQLEGWLEGRSLKPGAHCGSVQNPISQMRYEHENAGDALRRMRELTSDYMAPPDACESFRALYDGLRALEDDLHQHIHLENNILFPRAAALEAQHCKLPPET